MSLRDIFNPTPEGGFAQCIGKALWSCVLSFTETECGVIDPSHEKYWVYKAIHDAAEDEESENTFAALDDDGRQIRTAIRASTISYFNIHPAGQMKD